jgi:hypothetical protein
MPVERQEYVRFGDREYFLDFARFWEFLQVRAKSLLHLDLFGDYVVAEFDAFVTDVYGRSSDQFFYIILAFAAKRAGKVFLNYVPSAHLVTPASGFLVTIKSISPYALASSADMK